jgi:hypothetical protein
MAKKSETFTGGCTCGHVRYKMNSKPLIVHGCHCRLCQGQSGASFAVNALVEASRVEITKGEVVEVTVESPSGTGQRIARCPKCQVAVWSSYLVFGGNLGELVHFIKVGTLDDPDQFPPDVHIYTSTKQPWVILHPDTQAVDEFYVTSETWPQESLERLSVLLSVAEGNGS